MDNYSDENIYIELESFDDSNSSSDKQYSSDSRQHNIRRVRWSSW